MLTKWKDSRKYAGLWNKYICAYAILFHRQSRCIIFLWLEITDIEIHQTEKEDSRSIYLIRIYLSFIDGLMNSPHPPPEFYAYFLCVCRTSDLYVEHAFHLLRTQLTREHSEIRLSAFQVVDELFNRSHAFRELLVSDFQNFLELTVGKYTRMSPIRWLPKNLNIVQYE